MMLTTFKPRRAVHARLNVVRASPRVFTDSEWDSAIKNAAQMLAAAERAESATDSVPVASNGLAPPPAGRTFSDAQWEQAMKDAPMLLKTMEAIEKGAAGESPSTSEPSTTAASTGGARSTRVFSHAEWDAAIKKAVALQAADKEAEM